jgi:hypothetical protein
VKPLTLDEIADRGTYEVLRPEFREKVIALKQRRRVAVGERVTLVFENRETLRFQVQEMTRVERIDDPTAVQNELNVYNELMPGEDELSATLFIEIPELSRIKAELDRLVGIDEHVSLLVGDEAIPACFDPKQMEADRISAVQYIRFSLDEAQRRRLAQPSVPVRLRIDHPNYRHEATLPDELCGSLAADLRGECEPLIPPERWRGGGAGHQVVLEGKRMRVLRAAPGHLVVEPRDALPPGSLLGADDEALTLELVRTVERFARELEAEGAAPRIHVETGGDRPRWHLQAQESASS